MTKKEIKELKRYMKKDLKKAYGELKVAIISKDKKQIRNAAIWMIATCEALKWD